MKNKKIIKKGKSKPGTHHNFLFFNIPLVYRILIVVSVYLIACIPAYILYGRYFGGIDLFRPALQSSPITAQTGATTSIIPTFNGPTLTVCPPVISPNRINFPTDGKAHLLAEQLNVTGREVNCGDKTNAYYSAGDVPSGPYAGYKRVIYVGEGQGIYAQMYVTDDFKTYLLVNDPFAQLTSFGQQQKSVPASGVIDQEFPPDIPLPNNFAMHRTGIFYISRLPNNTVNTQTALLPDYSTFTPLKSFARGFDFYAFPVSNTNYPVSSDADYFTDITSVIVKNSSGIAYTYSLTTPASINKYNDALQQAAHSNRYDYYNDPNLYQPALTFKRSEINASISLYDSYNLAIFHESCGVTSGSTLVAKTVTDGDLHKIGNWQGIDIYALNDPNHPLYNLLYSSIAGKRDDNSTPTPTLQYIGNGQQYPTLPKYSDYIARNPLLFMKDPWGRWDMVAEATFVPLYNDGYIRGGCGKPVMYFYPAKQTEVKVSFRSPMRLDVQIPKYRNGWDILAEPNGMLSDLRQQSNDCFGINSNTRGSEYALGACNKNQYPYIYWAGQTLNTSYSLPVEGTFVDRNNLSSFLNGTLDYIGFKSNEKQDMLSYWLPEMLSKSSPYYRVSFLQTEDVNKLFPINISPHPDSVYRIFMDWEPLRGKPTYSLHPQNFEKITRKGFFMLEWGGVSK